VKKFCTKEARSVGLGEENIKCGKWHAGREKILKP
jgi:hypothetical protein